MSADDQHERPEMRRVPVCHSVHNLALFGLGAVVLLVFVGQLFLPRAGSAPASRRSQCKNNLKQIALAFQNYHDKYGCFPPAYVADEQGNPMHSWRVLLLPHLDEMGLYDLYRFDEPWNGLHNSSLAAEVLTIFNCPSTHDEPSTTTDYLLVIGPHTMFPGPQSTTKADITDDAGQTIMVAEVANSDVHWMEPRDLHVLQMAGGINPPAGQGISSPHDGGANVAFADGSVRFLSEQLDGATVRAMLTIDGGEVVEDSNF